MRPVFIALAVAFLAVEKARAGDFRRSFWVWHRAAPLGAEENAELARQEVRTLFWSVGEMELRGGGWRWKAPPLGVAAVAPARRVVPVVRLTSDARAPFAPAALTGLVENLKAVATSEDW